MLTIQNLSFHYRGHPTPILKNLNFTVPDGEIVAIVGGNGSGKSTLGRLIAGLEKTRTGTITIDGTDLRQDPNLARSHIGIVFQNPENQIIFTNIRDELAFSLSDLTLDEIDARIDCALDSVGMLAQKSRNLYELSLGQKQRIMLAEALAKNAHNLILDEPTTMIDSAGKRQIYQIIQNLKAQNYSILLFTNLADEILLADRTLILSGGEIVATIPRAELLDRADTLRQYKIVLPTLLELALELKSRGLNLPLETFTIPELADAIASSKHLSDVSKNHAPASKNHASDFPKLASSHSAKKSQKSHA